MSDNRETLRVEAAKCRQAAQRTSDLEIRAELIRRADKFTKLAECPPSPDLSAMFEEYNAQMLLAPLHRAPGT